MQKKILLLFVYLLAALTAPAQSHNVTRRPSTTTSRPNTSTNTKKTGTSTRKTGSASATPRKPSSGTSQRKQQPAESSSIQSKLNPIIQNLINNMVYVEGGTFTMGATAEQGPNVDDDEKPVHKVTLSSFYICRHEVTQEEWETVMGNNPSEFIGPKLPVECVSWNDCQVFIRKLNGMTGKNFRLPTEAEWEYAARGGKKSKHYKYSGGNNLDDVAWSFENSGNEKIDLTRNMDIDFDDNDFDDDDFVNFPIDNEDIVEGYNEILFENNCHSHQIMKKWPNELNIYDMSGNISEWCSDWYGKYNSFSEVNPLGPKLGEYRVRRGGSWNVNAKRFRISYRGFCSPEYKGGDTGLRLAL